MNEQEEVIIKNYDEKENEFFFERKSPYESRKLIYKSSSCILCEFCINSCPTSALSINVRASYIDALKLKLEPNLCTLCSICYNVCLFGSIEFIIDGSEANKVIRYEGRFEFFEERCSTKDDGSLCDYCEKSCPRNAIKAYLKNGKNTISRDESKCIYCRNCELSCPRNAIKVIKFLEGNVEYDNEKCQACGACINICPTRSIELSKKIGEKIRIREETCIYCKACMNVCPVNAIKIERKKFIGNIKVLNENISSAKMYVERAKKILD